MFRVATLVLILSFVLRSVAGAEEQRDAKGLLVNGAVATSLGITAVILGSVFVGMANSSPRSCGGGCADSAIVEGSGGGALIIGGVAHLLVGVPILATGAKRLHALRTRPIFSAGLAPRRDGVQATVGFAF